MHMETIESSMSSKELKLSQKKNDLSYTFSTLAGKSGTRFEKISQDNFIIRESIMKDIHLFAVCDGHGPFGRQCALLVKAKVPLLFIDVMQTEEGIENSLIKVCKRIQQELLSTNLFNTELSGCTLNGVVIDYEQNKVFSFNLGDSRCILIKENKKVKALSRDHRVDLRDEQARIYKCGGDVGQTYDDKGELSGPLRIFNKAFTKPGLEVSRSLGDQIAHQLGCSEIPEIQCHEMTRSDK